MAVKTFTAGEVLTAADLNDTIADAKGALAPRNLLYNGAMQVAQRGTSTASITTGGYYTADRWLMGYTSLGTWTQSVENDAPTGSGFAKSLKMLCTTADAAPAAGDQLQMQQRIEGQDLQRIRKGVSSADQVTLSFWVKSNVTGTYIVEFLDVDNSNQHVGAAYTVSAADTWEKKTVTFPGDTAGSPFANDNSIGAVFGWWLGAGTTYTTGTLQTSWGALNQANRAVGQTNLAAATNNYWQITGVQLEVGPTATPFEFKSYGTELAECQRYYQLRVSGSGKGFWNAVLYNTTSIYGVVDLPVTMRTGPTLSIVTGSNYYSHLRNNASDNFDAFVIDNATENAVELSAVSLISGTAGQGGWVRTNSASSFVAFQAEL
jgi:phage gp37-like protein